MPDILFRNAAVAPATANEAARTVDVMWSTGAAVRRFDLDGPFTEVLSLDPAQAAAAPVAAPAAAEQPTRARPQPAPKRKPPAPARRAARPLVQREQPPAPPAADFMPCAECQTPNGCRGLGACVRDAEAATGETPPAPEPAPVDAEALVARAQAGERQRIATIHDLTQRLGLERSFADGLVRRGVASGAGRPAPPHPA